MKGFWADPKLRVDGQWKKACGKKKMIVLTYIECILKYQFK